MGANMIPDRKPGRRQKFCKRYIKTHKDELQISPEDIASLLEVTYYVDDMLETLRKDPNYLIKDKIRREERQRRREMKKRAMTA